jgi:hypothetical protein|tara:strand:- start:32957 stop:33325 length:369 start_codon:yes stop_codon:yes gene_type:complete
MHSYSTKILFSLFLLSSVGIFSCKKKTTTVTTATCTSTISYVVDIKPLVDQNCNTSGCHNSGSSSGGYNLTTYGNVSSNADIILKTMRHSSGVKAMPQGSSKLASSTTDQFDCWIQQGKLNN